MSIQERVLTALRCEQPDRVPVFVYLDPYMGDHDPSYNDVMNAAKEYADVIYDWYFPSGFFHGAMPLREETRRLANGDIERVAHTPRGELTCVGRADWRGGGTVKRWLTTPDDVRKLLSMPYKPVRPDLSCFLDRRNHAWNQWVTQATFDDPICVAGLVDEASMAIWTIEHRDVLRVLLDTAMERVMDELKYCLENGVGPIYYFNGPEYALPPLMSPADFEEFVVKYDTRLVELIHSYPGNYVIIHSHGKVGKFLERFAAVGMDGLNVLEPPPLGDTILSEAKQRIGKSVCLIGNIQYDDIARGTEEGIERLVVEAISHGGPGGGFILSPCATPYEQPLPEKASSNLIHYLKMGRRHGRYPLVPHPAVTAMKNKKIRGRWQDEAVKVTGRKCRWGP